MPFSTGSETVRDACSDAPADFRPVDCELISIAGKAVSRGQPRSSCLPNPTGQEHHARQLPRFETLADGFISRPVRQTLPGTGRIDVDGQAGASRTARQVPVWTLSTEFQGRTHVATLVVDAVHGPLVPALRDKARSRPTRMRSGSRTSKTLSRSKRRENPPVPMTMARSPWNAWS